MSGVGESPPESPLADLERRNRLDRLDQEWAAQREADWSWAFRCCLVIICLSLIGYLWMLQRRAFEDGHGFGPLVLIFTIPFGLLFLAYPAYVVWPFWNYRKARESYERRRQELLGGAPPRPPASQRTE